MITMSLENKNRLFHIREALLGIIEPCRDDMHKPDNQNIFGYAEGYMLENTIMATKDNIINGSYHNLSLVLHRFIYPFVSMTKDDIHGVFNVADLLAIIKMQEKQIAELERLKRR